MQRSKKRNRRYNWRRRLGRVDLFRRIRVRTGRSVHSEHAPRRLHIFTHKYRIVWKHFIPCLFFVIIGVVSLSLLINYGVSSLKRQRTNEQLSREYSEAFIQAEETAAPAPTAVMQEDPSETMASQQAMPVTTFHDLSGEPMSKALKMYKQNNDLVGWLYIDGVVNLPVVYRDNEYYLDHNFNKKADKGGTLFLDENHPLTEQTQNLVIHGHNMYDSSMFGILSSYIHPGVVRSHAFATFSTMFAKEEYVVFSVMRVNPDVNSYRYFSYIGKPTFRNEEDFYSYTGEMKKRSLFDIPVDVQPADSLLTLSTCVDDDRLVVVYRRIRDGETKKDLQALVDQIDG